MALASFLLALALACGRPTMAAARAMDRPVDGFENSGYVWPKTLIWNGIRSSPGSLWLFYVYFLLCCYNTFAVSLITTAVAAIKRLVSQAEEDGASMEAAMQGILSHTVDGVTTSVTALLELGVLFVGLSATKLSEAAEAYLVAMVSIQLLLYLAPSSPSAQQGLWCLQLAAMFGIAMLDSYRPLNLLNAAYFGAAIFTQAAPACAVALWPQLPIIRLRLYAFSFCLQMGFSIAAFLVAQNVEGSHRGPMLALLCTACLGTAFSLLRVLCFPQPMEIREPFLP